MMPQMTPLTRFFYLGPKSLEKRPKKYPSWSYYNNIDMIYVSGMPNQSDSILCDTDFRII